MEKWFVRNTPPFFANRLQSIREKAGLSQYALAKLSGLSKQALSNLELGNREPNWNTVQRLAAALGVSCDDFIDPAVTQQTVLAEPRSPGSRRKDTQIAPAPKGRGRKTQIAPTPSKRPRSRPRKVDRKHHRPTPVEVSV
ncbi:hypothetical protein AYO44_14085 [Planctomycetaceae bacterium SCGC AG-212-F19]|nr:hypothetical protein AYO44_14085 [Planctomycetaceae bacterium SCGC AG-212-F19]